MPGVLQLWLPIVVTAILIFIASSLIHMVFKWHARDYGKLENEEAVRAVLRSPLPPPGQYVIPHATDMKELQNETMQRKYQEGPVALVTFRSNGLPMIGKSLLQWFVLSLIFATLAAGLAFEMVGIKGNAHQAGHLVAVVSFLAYGGGSVQQGIWMGKPWGSVVLDLLDSLIYAAISGVVFGVLW